MFAFAKGGFFGEAGPEAIMPLRTGPDGRLGVSAPANSNGAVTIIVTVNAPGASKDDANAIASKATAALRQELNAKLPQLVQTIMSPGGRRDRGGGNF